MNPLRCRTFTKVTTILALSATAAACVVDAEQLGAMPYDWASEGSGEGSAAGSEEDGLAEVAPPAAELGSAAATPAASATACADGCNDPPPCHGGPGWCNVTVAGSACDYPHVFNGTICNSGMQCVLAECISGTCSDFHIRPSGFPCDDGDPTTIDDTCDGTANCVGASACPAGCDDPPACHEGPGECVIGPDGLGVCSFTQLADEEACDSGQPCTLAQCNSGVCRAYARAPAGTACEDGDACTTADQCNAASTCVGGPSPGPPCSGPVLDPEGDPLPGG